MERSSATARLTDSGSDAGATARLTDPASTAGATASLGDPSPGPHPAAGRRVLDRYRLEERLGAGGFGVVWRAYDEKLERSVAVKEVRRDPDDPMPVRVLREARVAARLNHPGIVGLYELGSDDDAVYLVSELVPGRTLAELIRGGGLSDSDVARIGIALCDALDHAHRREVIHRDVKPQNVLVLAEPAAGAGFAKLADFGVARLTEGDPLTRTGDVVGTLAYMAPEQADGHGVGTTADVYSLALSLYEAWTGRNPVRGRGPASTARRLGKPLPPLERARRDLPVELCREIDAAVDPRPEVRPELDELSEVLEDFEPELAEEGGLVEPATLERFGLMTETRQQLLDSSRGSRLAAVAARLGAGIVAGALGLAALLELGPAPPASPLALAGAAGLLVALLPRVGWIAAASALVAWLGLPGNDAQGSALVVAAAAAPIPLLLPRAGLLWSVPAAAPLLGTIALAPVFVAVAGLAGTAWRRAGLAAAGLWWLLVGELLAGEALLLGVADGAQARAEWQDSLLGAGQDALLPTLTSPVVAVAAIWALFAAFLPLAVRGRSLWLDLALGGLWAAGLAVAHGAVGDFAAASAQLPTVRGAVAGAAVGLVFAVTAAAAGHGGQRAREAGRTLGEPRPA
jgi:eukaryotic-like serine/threonine-protein kinase